MAYLLDADVLIDAEKRYYGFGLAPGFWDWLNEANEAGLLFSVEKVQTELEAVDDALKDWVREMVRRSSSSLTRRCSRPWVC